ncbi:MAG: adenylosuccinate lyase family protein [Lewinella sp.]
MSLYQKLFYTDFTKQLCSDEASVQRMVSVEVALVKAQAKQGIIPGSVAESLLKSMAQVDVNMEALKAAIPLTGNAAAPLVKQIVAAVKANKPEDAKYIHLGATSQDIVDTATAFKINKFLSWVNKKIDHLEVALTDLTKTHRSTVMAGRTLMQQARPITFGLKTAGWLQSIRAARNTLKAAEEQVLHVQLGGAVGSRNEYLTKAVRSAVAAELGLGDALAWHTQRVGVAAFASALGVLCGTLAKMANDVVLLSQTEVGEVFEPAADGRGTSSTMPHKRNPVLSTGILANAHRVPFLVATILAAMPHEHERSAGRWHAEWEALDDIIGLGGGALVQCLVVMQGLEVNTGRMLQNIDLTQGLVFAETVSLALAETQGKQTAHSIVKTACQQAIASGKHLQAVLEDMDLPFTPTELDQFFRPELAIGASQEIIDETLSAT